MFIQCHSVRIHPSLVVWFDCGFVTGSFRLIVDCDKSFGKPRMTTRAFVIDSAVREFEKEPEELMFNIGLTKQHRTHSGLTGVTS